MTTWQLIFQQSRANNGAYNGDSLPVRKWDWPQETWFQKRLRSLRNHMTAKTSGSVHSTNGVAGGSYRMADKGGFPMSFSMVPLLLAEEEIPAEARQALVENRLDDAAELLIRDYGLSCIEAGDLLDVSACQEA
jgi:hypothetical protein